jgi:hypothetical protein
MRKFIAKITGCVIAFAISIALLIMYLQSREAKTLLEVFHSSLDQMAMLQEFGDPSCLNEVYKDRSVVGYDFSLTQRRVLKYFIHGKLFLSDTVSLGSGYSCSEMNRFEVYFRKPRTLFPPDIQEDELRIEIESRGVVYRIRSLSSDSTIQTSYAKKMFQVNNGFKENEAAWQVIDTSGSIRRVGIENGIDTLASIMKSGLLQVDGTTIHVWSRLDKRNNEFVMNANTWWDRRYSAIQNAILKRE